MPDLLFLLRPFPFPLLPPLSPFDLPIILPSPPYPGGKGMQFTNGIGSILSGKNLMWLFEPLLLLLPLDIPPFPFPLLLLLPLPIPLPLRRRCSSLSTATLFKLACLSSPSPCSVARRTAPSTWKQVGFKSKATKGSKTSRNACLMVQLFFLSENTRYG